MKHYIYIRDNIAYEIIPEINEAFPDIPIEDRYSKDFLDKCVVVEDGVEPPAVNTPYVDGKFVATEK